MSVYCSFAVFDDNGGDHPGPLVYRESHVLPHHDDTRGGSLDLGQIPAFITRDGRDGGDEDSDLMWPYLRVSLCAEDDDTVVLTARQVTELRDALTRWLARVDPNLDPPAQTPSSPTQGVTSAGAATTT